MSRRDSAPGIVLPVLGIGLVILGLSLGPMLLLRPEAQALRLGSLRVQLYAGFLYWTVGAALLVAPILALMTVPGDWFERWWTTAVARLMAVPERAFAAAVIGVTLAATVFLAFYSFDGRPTTADEIAQLWHARMLLHGRLSLPPDPNPEFFAIDNIIDAPRWMSQFPIGGPALLAVALATGVAWWLNPVLIALTALNVYRFTQRAFGEATARAAAAVFVSSPMVLLIGATHMNHAPAAWLVTLALAALPVWVAAEDRARLWRRAALIGASIGTCIAIRPLDGVVAGLVIGLAMLAVVARNPGGGRSRSLLVAMGAGAVPVALLLAANAALTGSPLLFGYEVLWGPNHSLGLHDDPTGNPHTAWRALHLAAKYALQINWVATAWPIPVLLVVAIGLVFARRHTRWDAVLLALFYAQLVAYAFYWHDGQFVGPRFLFTALPALVILCARAPFLVAERLRPGSVWWRITLVTIPVCIGVSWLRPMKPFGAQAMAIEYREIRARLKVDAPADVRSGTIQNALVFVQEGASARLKHRMWGIGVSRPDAARLLETADACSLFDAVRAEERRPTSDTAGRLLRIQLAIRPYVASGKNPIFPDASFRVTNVASITPACREEIEHDHRVKNTIAFGPMLLLNRFDGDGRLAGPVVYAMDLRDRNELLRNRFGNRRWYRYEIPRNRADSLPVLVPYGPAR
jgi:hypothetical protein